MPVAFRDPRLPSRFWAKVERSPNGCWHWTGYVDKATGYGSYALPKSTARPAHRVAYEALVRPLIPRGQPGHQQVDHECHNRSKSCSGGPSCLHRRCVNPAHLQGKTPASNSAASDRSTASRNRAKTHCSRGHEFTAENIYWSPNGGRHCKRCQIDQTTARRRERAAERGPVPSYQLTKTHCLNGHPYSGDNLYVAPDGRRVCRSCSRDRQEALKERRRAGTVRAHASKTHCPQGHPFSGENLFRYGPDKRYRGCKACRAAARDRARGKVS